MKQTLVFTLIAILMAAAQAKDQKGIHSKSDFTAFLKSRHGIAGKIASKCSGDEIKVMTQSIVFKEGHLSDINVDCLKGKLTKEEFNQLWTEFGENPKAILIDYHCIGTSCSGGFPQHTCNTDYCHP